MSMDFLELMKKRHYETVGVVRGVKIIERSRTMYNCLVEDALDLFYSARVLEEGNCTVCQTGTSKFCSDCGIHYCSTDCQKIDWENHALICIRCMSSLTSSVDLNIEEKLELEKKTSFEDVSKQSNAAEIKKEQFNKKNQKFQSKNNVEAVANNITTYTNEEINEATKRAVPTNVGVHQTKKTMEKKEHVSKKNVVSCMGRPRRFSPGQKLRVKCTSKNSNVHWVIEYGDFDELKNLEKVLSEEAENYPPVIDVKNDVLYAMLYYKKWYRCLLLSYITEKKLFRCIDYGITFCPKVIICRELPDHIHKIRKMAFKVQFVNSTPPNDDSFFDIQVVSRDFKGVYEVEICEDKKNTIGEIGVKNAKGNVTKKKIKSGTVVGEKSIFEILTSESQGFFLVGRHDGEILTGCLVIDDNIEATECYRRMKNIDDTRIIKTRAEVVSDVVLIVGRDGIAYRGVVKFKNKNHYTVHLIDYGHTIETDELYILPKEMTTTIRLECRVVLTSPLYRQLDVKKPFFFKGMKKLADRKWECQFSYDKDCSSIFSQGIVESLSSNESINYVSFKDGCSVTISFIGKWNEIFVMRDEEKWKKNLKKLNEEINYLTDVTDVHFPSICVGDLVLAKYRNGGLWYRAQVVDNSKIFTNSECEVLFIDYGNYQDCIPSELKILPKSAKNVPIFLKKVKLSGPDDSFSPQGRSYLEEMIRENRLFIMRVCRYDSVESVILINEDGDEINKFVFSTQKISVPAYVYDPCISELTENLVVLYVNEREFKENGIFWAASTENKHFKYIMFDLAYLLIEHYELNATEYIPKEGEPCAAKYKGGWYRGKVVLVEESVIKVFFVDFGNTEFVEIECLRKLEPNFFEVPVITAECILYEFSKYSGNEIERYYSLLLKKTNNSLKNKAVVKEIVENLHYVSLEL